MRDRETLVGEASRIITRVKAAFVRLGIRRTPEVEPIPPNTLAALKRDLERHRIVKQQIREIEQTRLERLGKAPAEGSHAMVRLLASEWREANGIAHRQMVRRLERDAEPKLRKIKAMTDPVMNPNEHQREVAEAILAKMQAKLQAEIRAIRLPPAPGLEDYDHQQAKSQATTSRANIKMREMFENDVADAMRDIAAKSERVNTKAKSAPVNTSNPRKTADSLAWDVDLGLGLDLSAFGLDQPVNTSEPEPEPKAKPEAVNTKRTSTIKPRNRADTLDWNVDLGLDWSKWGMPEEPVNTSEPNLADEPVNTKPSEPSSDRNRDRHSPGYMREYMRRRRAAKRSP
jgi:hypothetical protein